MLLQLLLQKMHILMAWCETLLNICAFLLTVEDGYDSKSCLYFEAQICQVQDSFECIQEAPSKDSIIRVCYVDHIKGNVFSSGILRCAEGHRKCDGSDRFDSFPTEAIERLRQFVSCFRSNLILSKVVRKRISAWLPLSMRILVTSHLSMWTVTTIASVCGDEVRLMS
jgi:hypothetical protein